MVEQKRHTKHTALHCDISTGNSIHDIASRDEVVAITVPIIPVMDLRPGKAGHPYLLGGELHNSAPRM